VGQRVGRLLARNGSEVRVGSRQKQRAQQVSKVLQGRIGNAKLEPVATGTAEELARAVEGRTLIIAAGAAGAILLPKSVRSACPGLRVAIDLNAVPPSGIEGVEIMDKGKERDGVVAYGAIGVGDTKMKIHKAAIAKLFERNDLLLDAEEVYEIAKEI
jgi:hypothetical protein